MIRLPLMGALAVLPLSLSADEVVVRSGEHPGFSRLVLEFDNRPQWSLRVVDGQAKIVLPAGGWSFDTGGVFTRIPRTRIIGVTGTADGLEVTLGCDCRVAAFEVRGTALAIDVADPVPQDRVRNLPATSSSGSGAAQPVAPPAGDIVSIAPLALRYVDEAAEHGFAPRILDAPMRPQMMPLQALPSREADPPAAGEPPNVNHRVLADLTEGIARAATQGILSLAPQAERAASEPTFAAIATPQAANVRLRLPGEASWLPQEAPEGNGCRGDAAYDVAAWGPSELSASTAIGERRAAVAADLDTIDEERAVDLARLYIAIGFGAEARAVLEAMAPRHPETAPLDAMASILDGDPPPGAFEVEADCPGRVQLWVALATGRTADAEAVKVAVAELPLELRRHVGPRLITVFLAGGDPSTAESVRAAIGRAAGPHGTPFDLAAASLDADRGTPQGMARIRGLASEPSPSSDEALALLFEVAHQQGRTVDAGSIAHAETRADDLRGAAEGARLEIGLVHALLRADDFGRAASRLVSAIDAKSLQEDSVAALAEAILSALAERGTDETVLIHAAALQGQVADLVRDGPVGAEVASRLLDLGLPRLARHYLPEVPSGADSVAMTARLRLLSGDPAGALALLDRLDEPGPDHLRTREEALRSVGRLEEAAAIRMALGKADTADRKGLSDDPLTRGPPNVATNSTESPEGPEDSDGAGSSPSALVAASEETRRRIDALLAAHPGP